MVTCGEDSGDNGDVTGSIAVGVSSLLEGLPSVVLLLSLLIGVVSIVRDGTDTEGEEDLSVGCLAVAKDVKDAAPTV